MPMKSMAGTYAIIMGCRREARVQVGKFGHVQLHPGIYVYVGSAFGPGGVRARVGRYLKRKYRPHWHIDYVLPHVDVTDVWYTHEPIKREHEWAQTFANTPGASIPYVGFGSSDCDCDSHFFYFSEGTCPEREMPSLGGRRCQIVGNG